MPTPSIPSTPYESVVKSALAGEQYERKEGEGRVTFQVEPGVRVSVIETGTVYVLGRLAEKVTGGVPHKGGKKFLVRDA